MLMSFSAVVNAEIKEIQVKCIQNHSYKYEVKLLVFIFEKQCHFPHKMVLHNYNKYMFTISSIVTCHITTA
jgi:hypothetical protein